jgi:hypothetical protein
MNKFAFFQVSERQNTLRKVVYQTLRRVEKYAESVDVRLVERVLKMFDIPDYKTSFAYEKQYKKAIENHGVTFYAMGERLSKGTSCHYPDAVCTRIANWSQRKWYHFCPLNNEYTLWAVRKDVMCLLHATDTMRNMGEELMFENLTKHWTYASNKHIMLDKMRKWCSAFGVLNWISSDRNMHRQSGDMLSPDHPDFDDMFDILNDVMSSVSDNRGLFEELIKYSYANPYKPSLLRGFSSFLRLKKHHIIDRSVVRCIRAYLTGDDATVMCWLKERALRYLPSHLMIPLIADLNLQMRKTPSERSENVTKNMEMVLDTLDQVRTISDRLVQYVEIKPGVEYKAFVETYSEQHSQKIEKRGLKRKIECSIYENNKGQEVMEPTNDETFILNDTSVKTYTKYASYVNNHMQRGGEGIATVVSSGGKIVKKIKTKDSAKEANDAQKTTTTTPLLVKRFLELPEMSDDFMRSSAKISTECYIKTPESAYNTLYDVKRFLGSEEHTLHQMLRSLAKLERVGIQTSLDYPYTAADDHSEFESEKELYNIYEKSGFLRAILAKVTAKCNMHCTNEGGQRLFSDLGDYPGSCHSKGCACLKNSNRSCKPLTESLILDLTSLFGKIWDIYIDGDGRSREDLPIIPKKKQTETYKRAKTMRDELNRYKIACFFEKCKYILTDYGCIMDMLQIIKEDEHKRNCPTSFYFNETSRHPSGIIYSVYDD